VLFGRAKPLLEQLVEAALAPAAFDAATSTRTLRIGLSDAMEGWLLPPLLAAMQTRAPNMKLVSTPVQFRTVGEALANGRVDMALTVADDLPANVRRESVLHPGFVCLFDPRKVRIKGRVSERDYFAHEHAIVSYNADLRGVIEDMHGKQRRVRCAVGSFSHIGQIVEGSALLATVPTIIAQHVLRLQPALRTTELPFPLGGGSGIELLWSAAQDDDSAGQFVREQLRVVCGQLEAAAATSGNRKRKRKRG
jgi:LysR family transcriptional activator of mexEF-oprN operon